MQNLPLIFEHKKFPIGMKINNMSDVTTFKNICSSESTTLRCYSLCIVVLVNVDFI